MDQLARALDDVQSRAGRAVAGLRRIAVPAGEGRKIEFWTLSISSLLLGVLVAWLVYEGEAARLNDSGMRILWQLIKATGAALVLLAGCALVFKKRAGVVVLHGGIGLMMLSELLVGTTAIESQMQLKEGEVTNFVHDTRFLELAVVDNSDKDTEDQVVVPESLLQNTPIIRNDQLPFDVKLVSFIKNADMVPIKQEPKASNPATTGLGRDFVAKEMPAAVGTDMGGGIDMAAAYVTLLRKGTQEPLGTWLVSVLAALQDFPEKVTVDGKTYDLSLRFKRFYKPYSVSLIDVRKEDYLGTDTPRNYSSDVHLIDESRNVDRKIHIWMNNPLRFAGETFYQSGYQMDPATKVESTTLSVVTNTGWMIPYVACMIVAVGMLAHFSITLSRFLSRRAEGPAGTATPSKTGRNVQPAQTGLASGALATWFPVGMALFAVMLFAYEARVPHAREGEMDLYQFGKLPLVYEGRVKPFDTLARNSLRAMSDRQSFKDNDGKTQPAIRWFLDTATDLPVSHDYRVLRIDHPEVLDLLGLERRPSYLYSVDEIRPKVEELEKQVDLVRDLEKKKAPLSVFQQRVMELDQRTRAFTMIHASFDALQFPPFPNEEEFKANREKVEEQVARIKAMLNAAIEQKDQLNRFLAPRSVPDHDAEGGWITYPWAVTEAYFKSVRQDKLNPSTANLETIFAAYARHDVPAFNAAVTRYQSALAASPPKDYEPTKVDFEAFFNHFEPFFWAAWSYLLAFVLAAIAWLGWSKPLNRAAFYLNAVTFVVHTFSLIGRIYISGRPPVTNLYSAAVFIGFACVLLGIVLEKIYKLGIGNLLAGITGFASLFIAHLLAASGDTFTVLQAVLDTQFWLATHVVCITLGYATTYLAGILALLYVLLGVCTPYLTTEKAKDLTRMIYGGLCFAIFFSFVGTVLGGLWADDSWGRFWGWDPKENGALMIVLWNALVLHARWGGMVKDRGLALLAIVGNIMVSWSFFGVNQLGIGLHSYGRTHGVVEALVIFALCAVADHRRRADPAE